MSKRIASALVTLFFCLGCTTVVRSDSSVSYEFIVVDETFSATRKIRDYEESGSNLFPWIENVQTSESGDEEVIVVSNNCGFAEYEYRGINLDSFHKFLDSDADDYPRETVIATGTIGEWCRLATHIYEHETLLTLRSWNDNLYIVGTADLYFDSSGDAYVVDTYFVDEWQLSDLVKPIPDAGEQDSCWRADGLTLREQEAFERDGYKRFDDYYCAVTGIYVRDFAKRLN